MKICRNIETELSAFVDGELTPPAAAEVQAHVEACPHCQQRVTDLRKLVAGVAALPKAEPAPRFLADVRRKIRQPAEPDISWVDALFRPLWLKVPLEALAAVLIVAVVVVLIRPGQYEAAKQSAMVAKAPASPAATPAPAAMKARILGDERMMERDGLAAADKEMAAMPAELSVQEQLKKEGGAGARAKLSQVAAQAEPARLDVVGNIRAEAPEVIVVRGDSLVAVQLRAENLARELNGRVQSTAPTNAFLVYLPRANVSAFRTRLARAHPPARERKNLTYAAPSASTTATMATKALGGKGSSLTNLTVDALAPADSESLIELEVVVEPATEPAAK